MKTKDEICVFDFIYYFNNTAGSDRESVGAARFQAGCELAKLYKINADVVAGVPNTALEVAKGYSYQSGLEYCEIMRARPEVGRYFVQNTAEKREQVVNEKFVYLKEKIKDKKIILIDDSLVRGITLKNVIRRLREYGAQEIHVLLASPAVVGGCKLLQVNDKNELIATGRTVKQIQEAIKADSVNYLPNNKVIDIYGNGKKMCTACLGDAAQ